jgi:hypothetical protein
LKPFAPLQIKYFLHCCDAHSVSEKGLGRAKTFRRGRRLALGRRDELTLADFCDFGSATDPLAAAGGGERSGVA